MGLASKAVARSTTSCLPGRNAENGICVKNGAYSVPKSSRNLSQSGRIGCWA